MKSNSHHKIINPPPESPTPSPRLPSDCHITSKLGRPLIVKYCTLNRYFKFFTNQYQLGMYFLICEYVT